jgi:hypothetical protein
VSLEISGASAADVHGETELQAFLSDEQDPDIQVNVRWADTLSELRRQKAFESGAIWRLFHINHECVFEFTTPLLGDLPYKRMRVGPGFRLAEVILSRAALVCCGKVSPLEYPACELLITNYLACRGLGAEVHGCGLIDDETGGHLFLGHSGAGKSTTARLWETFRSPEILSDDRIILRLQDGELWMYGTPWHGEAQFASPGKAKVNKIHILRHGSENKFAALSQARAVGEILARSFPPFHSPAGLESTLAFIKRALDVVPCYEFEFQPDGSSVAAVLGFRNHD